MSLKIRKNDMVVVISGRDKGKTGRVLAVFPKRDKALVEDVNVVKRHTRPKSQQEQGGIIEKEMPIHISNLMLVDVKTNRASRFGVKKDDKGNKIRVIKATGNEA